ncbi:secondary thiamine-phosphate synthase enzyme YjbQ [Candidatus Woesearchaeota archaeon]|nr:secondary thiamine-phosphate synthase enzyme YjbQ [Candidatus Woesearchaeota archaeon]
MAEIDVYEKKIKTKKEFQIIDITEQVKKYLSRKKVHKGLITITTKHTTTAIRVNEKESRLLKDIKKYLYEIAPKCRSYLHDDIGKRKNCPKNEPKNAHAHLKAILMGASETLPIKNGKLNLGRWQRVLFIELDGPRERTIVFGLVAE